MKRDSTGNGGGVADPRHTIIVLADDGKFYRITKEQWRVEENQVSDAGGRGLLEQLANFGTYMAYIPPDMAVGIGHVCTMVNLKAILKNNP